MITLSDAFRLCKISNSESVYLIAATNNKYEDHRFWSSRLIELVDMKKINVVGIAPRFERYGNEFFGMQFRVQGITDKELRDLSLRAATK